MDFSDVHLWLSFRRQPLPNVCSIRRDVRRYNPTPDRPFEYSFIDVAQQMLNQTVPVPKLQKLCRIPDDDGLSFRRDLTALLLPTRITGGMTHSISHHHFDDTTKQHFDQARWSSHKEQAETTKADTDMTTRFSLIPPP